MQEIDQGVNKFCELICFRRRYSIDFMSNWIELSVGNFLKLENIIIFSLHRFLLKREFLK